ncbi:MAG TPA: hypothetical protein VLF66_20855 [Thermoanaerobaculia bacterium]|nr:hypothetical protein [Thermoanaerobaculia bacterium]
MSREERRDRDDRWDDDRDDRREGPGPGEDVVERRREVEERLAEVRAAIGRETGVAPAARYSLLALVAGAVGLALARRRRRSKRRK